MGSNCSPAGPTSLQVGDTERGVLESPPRVLGSPPRVLQTPPRGRWPPPVLSLCTGCRWAWGVVGEGKGHTRP